MHASVQGALAQINKSWKAFTHKGKPMTKEQVTKVLIYANNKGYKSTAELSDEEIDKVLSTIQAVIPNVLWLCLVAENTSPTLKLSL